MDSIEEDIPEESNAMTDDEIKESIYGGSTKLNNNNKGL